MSFLAILNDVHDAEYVIRHHVQFDKVTLISTHAAVDDYLAVRNLTCRSISSWLKSEEITRFYEEADCVNALLSELDSEFGEVLNSTIGLDVQLRFFHTLYRYLGRYEYVNLLKLQTSLRRLLTSYTPEKIFLFQPHGQEYVPSFFFTNLGIYQLIIKSSGIPVETISAPLSQRINLGQKLKKARRMAKANVLYLLRNPLKSLMKYFRRDSLKNSPVVIRWNSPRGMIVLLNGPDSAELLPGVRRDIENISLGDPQNPSYERAVLPVVLQNTFRYALDSLETDPQFDLKSVIKVILLEDLSQRFGEVVFPVQNLHRLRMEHPILGGVWVSAPAMPNSCALLTEYLICSGSPVVGRQHGGNYGIEVSQPKHFDSDYWWSTHYLSYGFTAADLKESSPALKPRCEILPVGEKILISLNASTRRMKLDILFPISNAVSFHHEGVRTLLHELAEYQRELLKFLDQLSGVRVAIKPFSGYDYSTSAFVELLRTLKNVEVVEDISFAQALENYSVGAIVSEFPSSPLFECLRTDAEVLSLTNPLLPFNKTASALLHRRIHFYDTLPQIKMGVMDFLEGRLPQRRDTGFVNRYLLTEDIAQTKAIVAGIMGVN